MGSGAVAIDCKRCSRCRRSLPMSAFAKRGGKRSGRISWCSGCTKEAREARQAQPEPEKRVTFFTEEARAACAVVRAWPGPTEAGPLRPMV